MYNELLFAFVPLVAFFGHRVVCQSIPFENTTDSLGYPIRNVALCLLRASTWEFVPSRWDYSITCESGTAIQTKWARFGRADSDICITNCSSAVENNDYICGSDTLGRVLLESIFSESCDNKTTCDPNGFVAKYLTQAGDFCTVDNSYIHLSYVCAFQTGTPNDNIPGRSIVCHYPKTTRELSIACVDGLLIDITYAMFGRITHSLCQVNTCSYASVYQPCIELDNTHALVEGFCTGRPSCAFQVSLQVFATMSIGSCISVESMYLDVAFVCKTKVGCLAIDICEKHKVCIDHYPCRCPDGFTGEQCNTSIDDCTSAPCQNGGQCVDLGNGYTCNCSIWYEGENCEAQITLCLNNPCKNNGTCQIDGTRYVCLCTTFFTGSNCQYPQHCAVLTQPCDDNGVCVQSRTSYTCDCEAGYSGASCEFSNHCSSLHPCQNGGTCLQSSSNYSCLCSDGFAGFNCQYSYQCELNPCVHGVCIQELAGYQCQCELGFDGRNCQTADQCNVLKPCRNAGICRQLVATYECACRVNFVGVNCEEAIHCQTLNRCLNGGVCIQGAVNYSCSCTAGFTGEDCGTSIIAVINMTHLQPPYNDTNVIDTALQFNTSMCETNPCLNYGSCIPHQTVSYLFTCRCVNGFAGLLCEKYGAPLAMSAELGTGNQALAQQVSSMRNDTVILIVLGCVCFVLLSAAISIALIQRYKPHWWNAAHLDVHLKIKDEMKTVVMTTHDVDRGERRKFFPIPPNFQVPIKDTPRYRALVALGVIQQMKDEAATQRNIAEKTMQAARPLGVDAIKTSPKNVDDDEKEDEKDSQTEENDDTASTD